MTHKPIHQDEAGNLHHAGLFVPYGPIPGQTAKGWHFPGGKFTTRFFDALDGIRALRASTERPNRFGRHH